MYLYKHILFLLLLIKVEYRARAQQILKPFPQHVTYTTGTIQPSHVSQQQLDDSTTSFYNSWKKKYIKQEENDGTYYVWSEQNANTCVSEGQGYGMVITALMAGHDKDAQKVYDGMFRYYRAHPADRNKYLMAWAQDKLLKNKEGTSATDGDMDIAYSLLLANAQWGSGGSVNYVQEARYIISAIEEKEINKTTFSVLLSDAVEADSKDYFDMRSSDFMPAHFRVFKRYGDTVLWDKVINNNYDLFSFLQKKYSPEAGLVPDFILHINTKAQPARGYYLESEYDGNYNYNACRVPWRIATDYIVNGDMRSKAFVQKINDWITGTTNNIADNISAGYNLDGEDLKERYFEAMSFIGPFAVAAMTDKKYQGWLNKLWDYMEGFKLKDFDYYDNTIKMINLIILSGNYWAP